MTRRTEPRRSKFRNVKTVVNGLTFDSKKEAARYQELRLLEKAGEIGPISCQVPYEFHYEGKTMFRYIADFVYADKNLNKIIVEDVKGYRTPTYRLKKKLIEAQWNFEIQEV